MQVEAQEVVTENFTADNLRSYLLGMLPEDLQEQIEQRLLTDASLMEQLHAAEEDLADDYVVGALEGLESEAFETVFLAHPDRQRKLSFANALHRYATASPQQPSRRRLFSFFYKQAPIFQVALATACLMVIVLGGWGVMQTRRLQRELDNTAAQQQNRIEDLRRERAERQQLEQELAALKAGAQN